MKKKFLIGIVTMAFLLGLGNVAFANGLDGNGDWSFKNMLPYMQEMHPSFSDDDLEQMYNDCYDSGDVHGNIEMGTSNMMSQF